MHYKKYDKSNVLSRVFTYLIMTTLVVVVVFFSLAYILGYQFDLSNNKVRQSGLVQIISIPNGAKSSIDNNDTGQLTPTKKNVLPGTHQFSVTLDGYRQWNKKLDIKAGTISWLNYIRLIPNNLEVETIARFDTLGDVKASTKKNYFAVIPNLDRPTIEVFNLNSTDFPKSEKVIIDKEVISDIDNTNLKHEFRIYSWNESEQQLLIKHTYSNKNEFILVNINNSNSTNLSKLLDVNIQKIEFKDSTGRQFIGLIDGAIRMIDADVGTLSGPLESSVNDFWFNNESNSITYVNKNLSTGKDNAGVLKLDSQPTLVKELDAGFDHKYIKSANYFSQDYVAVANGKLVTVYGGSIPANNSSSIKKLFEFNTPEDITDLQFSPSGRFIVAQQLNKFISYDIETKLLSKLVELSNSDSNQQIKWLDEFMIWTDGEDQLNILEFDGENKNFINNVVAGYDIALSNDERFIYSIGRDDLGFSLQRVKLRVK